MYDEYTIKTEYKELLKGEEEILKELNKPGGLEKGYKIYYLLDKNWVEEYKNLISNNNIKESKNLLKVSLIKKKMKKKILHIFIKVSDLTSHVILL